MTTTEPEDISDIDLGLPLWGVTIDRDLKGPAYSAVGKRLKIAGLEHTVWGFTTPEEAQAYRDRVARTTGIELQLFNHDDEVSE